MPILTLIDICGLVDHTASSLATVADSVSALCCEALKADTDSGDKDVASVSRDMKVLLNGSKLCGNPQYDQVDNNPVVRASEDLTARFCSLALALKNLGKSSWHRANLLLCLKGLEKDKLFPTLVDSFNAGCPGLDNLNDSVKAAVMFVLEEKYVESLHEIYTLSQDVKKILYWEATVSFITLEGSIVDKKKGKIKKVMGKGTTVLMQCIKDISTTDSSTLAQKVAQGFLDPHLLQKLREVVNSNESRRLPKLPKGTRDFAKEQMAIKERAFRIVENVFKRHGAMALDTPAFEMRETLTGKYGEDSKLIYDLADQGEEMCSLRYDLTVPFARYVAMNGLTYFRRYQIGKVHRRDNPSKGRFREFYQCDFDIAGDATVAADFKAVRILVELLDELDIGDYEIKLNHRKMLDGMLKICRVPFDKMRTICSSIDKLDKQSFEQIKKEMIKEKGLDAETVEKVGKYVCLKDHPLKLLSQLKEEGSVFLENEASNEALKYLEKLFEYLDKRCWRVSC